MSGERIGLIAGNGSFPLVFAERARAQGVSIAAVAHRGETDPAIEGLVESVTWIDTGQIGAMIAALAAAGVTRAVMVGGITKPRLFEHFKPDHRALALLARVGPNPYVLFGVASYEYLGVGLGTVAITAFIQQQTSMRFTATQLALLTTFATLPRTLATATTGFIIEAVGYFNFFLICTAIAVPGMLLLFWVAPWSGDLGRPEPQSAQS